MVSCAKALEKVRGGQEREGAWDSSAVAEDVILFLKACISIFKYRLLIANLVQFNQYLLVQGTLGVIKR